MDKMLAGRDDWGNAELETMSYAFAWAKWEVVAKPDAESMGAEQVEECRQTVVSSIFRKLVPNHSNY